MYSFFDFISLTGAILGWFKDIKKAITGRLERDKKMSNKKTHVEKNLRSRESAS